MAIPVIPLIWSSVAAILAGGVLACVYWDEIYSWINKNKNNHTDYGEIIKEQYSSGNYKLISGVFDKHGKIKAKKEWVTKDLDAELKKKFATKNKIRI